MKRLLLFLAALLPSFLLVPTAVAVADTHVIAPQKANKLIEAGGIDLILDVRNLDEYTGPLGRLKNAQLLPVHELAAKVATLAPYKNKTILIYCHSGHRSSNAAHYLREQGFTAVLDLQGGIVGWRSEGMPTVTGP